MYFGLETASTFQSMDSEVFEGRFCDLALQREASIQQVPVKVLCQAYLILGVL